MKEMRAMETIGRVIDARHIGTMCPVRVGQRVRNMIF